MHIGARRRFCTKSIAKDRAILVTAIIGMATVVTTVVNCAIATCQLWPWSWCQVTPPANSSSSSSAATSSSSACTIVSSFSRVFSIVCEQNEAGVLNCLCTNPDQANLFTHTHFHPHTYTHMLGKHI